MLQKIKLSPGVNREGTNLSNESGWWACDKVRFRSGYPEKIGGWVSFLLSQTYTGICRALFNWASISGSNTLAVGTHVKFYAESGGVIYDITPIRATHSLGASPFATVSGSTTVTVTDTNHGALDGDYVSLTGAAAVAGITLTGEYVISYISVNS